MDYLKERFKRIFKLRFAVIYPFCIFAFFFTHSDAKSLSAGICFIAAGLFVRMWANGYAIKMEKLTISGPYAFIRHPLYFGTMLLAVGFAVMIKNYYIGILFLVVMFIVYRKTIKKEETMLEDKFKEDYVSYKKKVPAFFPTIFQYKKGEKWPFSFKRLLNSQEYKLFFWVIIVVIVFHLKDAFMIRRETLNPRTISLIAIAAILASIDLTGEIIKLKNKKNKQGQGK